MAVTVEMRTQVSQLYYALFGRAPDAEGLGYWVQELSNGKSLVAVADEMYAVDAARAYYPLSLTNEEIVESFYLNTLGRAADAEGLAYWTAQLNAPGATEGSVISDLIVAVVGYTGTDADALASQALFNNKVEVGQYYGENNGDVAGATAVLAPVTADDATVTAAKASIDADPVTSGTNFTINGKATDAGTDTAGNEVMLLKGDQDVRIDFTNPANQIKGRDLNGDGTIANDGIENAITGVASNFEIVDAYARNPLNETSITQNFLGDIAFDGTGFGGDGVTTDGNIVLGGLGVDSVFGGIGNDFLTGGGIAAARVAAARAAYVAANPQDPNGTGYVAPADSLSGGRNADFFFVELSALDATDGNRVNIDGGTTADDSAAGIVQTAQDADWLLFEGSDDDEPVTIRLRDESSTDNYALDLSEGNGAVVNRAGVTVSTIRDIENFDASGNLYGFLDNVNVELGGRRVDDREVQNGTLNNGIGSSAQVNVSGSKVANIIIGGYDNDRIDGNAGNDLLMGGNLNNLINPNLLTIVNDGRDDLFGGAGNDDIVFEADGGNIEGDSTQGVIGAGNDTLWLTNRALGTQTSADLTTDGVLRFDLDSQDIDIANGYGGANVGSRDATANDTQDQTNYKAGVLRTTVQDMENVIATGLGAVDYDTDGSNVGDIAHLSQVNQAAYEGNLTLRGTAGANILYASSGTDIIEGRTGNDSLSGGNGDDAFVFYLQDNAGDGVDVIHRQADANGDNIWDNYGTIVDSTGAIIPRVGTFVQDFGQVSAAVTANSKLTLTLIDTSNPADLTGFPVNGVSFKLDGVDYTVALTSGVQSTYAAFNDGLNAALDANPALVNLNSVLNADNTMTITDPAGKTFVSIGYTFVGNVVPPAGTLTWNQAVGGPSVSQTKDTLIYRSYEDRNDGETVDDDAVTGSIISLGNDAYAEDLVINFSADGTRIAEEQAYTIVFNNLTTQDKVTIAVNGVTYTLQVGVDLDGNSIAGEDGVGDTQANIQSAFVTRLNAFINSFMDNDTAAGQVASATNGTTTLTLTQALYNTEETVFMTTPVVTIENLSNGESATAVVTNVSDHEVHLLNYDGRNLDGTGVNLDGTNVLFVGDTNVNQSLLQTANNLTGGTITGTDADLVDGGANDLANIANNTATNANLALNFSVHGDDFILGGAAVDTISAGTGDDRVQGSRGNDVLDGGKNYYAVKVLGETESRVVTWNTWEAANPASAQALLADPTLAGKTLTSITLIDQTESGAAPVVGSGNFNDTLIYAQGDFTTGATRFTVTLNNYTVNAGVVALNNGGAGTVGVDLTGDGVIDSTSTFTNFENVRTVSGTGLAVAGVGGGQGNDTLDVSALSTSTGGVSYDLTNRAVAAPTSTAGDVRYSTNADTADGGGDAAGALFADENDFETAVIKVDGVESLIGGTGSDLLMIDETEAAKDNSFTAGLGNDRIEYLNDFTGAAGAAEAVAQPTVTIKVNAAADTDTVAMTSGRVGTVVATDTLVSVERIALNGFTAEGSREADVLDVTMMATGAVVDYTNGQVRDLAGIVQVTIENIAELENVWADGNDTVIVADNMGALNAREDNFNTTAAQDIALATFIDYDELSTATATLNKRVAFASQTSAQIENVINQNQYTFSMSKVGTDADTDTVDYSGTLTAVNNDNIAVRVELDAAQANQYVMVDVDGVTFGGAGDLVQAGDRVDVLTSVERIVASTGESVLDLTASNKSLEVVYQALDVANRVASMDRDVYNVQISDLSSSVPLTRNYVEYRDAGLLAATATVPNQVSASWNRIEGSDFAERVVMNSAHSANNNTMNLRGGANEVKYNELTRSITTTLNVVDYNAALAATTGIITATVQFQDGTGAGVEGPMLNGTTDTITSYTANNGISTGSLRIAASQDAEDTLKFAGLSDKLFLISETGTTDNQITVKLGSGTAENSIVLTGFELISDAAGNDIYDFGSIVNAAAGLNFIDAGADHDTVKVGNDAASATFGGGATTISLAGINATATLAPAGFDFDVLDVTKVTDAAITTLTGLTAGEGTDEVVLGALNGLTNINNFESVVLTQATVTGQGTTFSLNTTTNTLVAGAKTLTFNQDMNVLSFGGLALEGAYGTNTSLNATGNVTVTVVGNEAVTLIGGNGNDSLTGSGGSDTLVGGAGNDILNGGFTAAKGPIYTVTIPGVGTTSGIAGSTMVIGGLTITSAAVPVGAQVGVAADADQIGAAFAAQSLASWQTALNAAGGLSVAQAATLTGVTYDATSNALAFAFSTSNDAALINAALITNPSAAGATMVATEADTQGWSAQVESQDDYIFGATAALNGVDTINNFNAAAAVTDDVLDFSAFLGVQNAAAANATNLSSAGADLVLTTGAVAVAFNKAALTAADVVAASTATVGEIVLADGGKAVVLVSADADGVADVVANSPYDVYYIEDTNTSLTAQTWTVTKVATINSTAELAANNVLVENLVLGSSAANVINVAGAAAGQTILSGSGNDTITGSSFADTIDGGAGADTINAGLGADTVTIGAGRDVVTLTEGVASADSLIWSNGFVAGSTNAANVTDFAFGAGADTLDINVALTDLAGTTTAAGTGATNTIAAIAVIANANNTAAGAADASVVYTFAGAGDLLAAGTTIDTAVANAVTALTSGADWSANIALNDSLILQMNDGANTFVFHYVGSGVAATTEAADLSLIGVFNGTTAGLVGDFI